MGNFLKYFVIAAAVAVPLFSCQDPVEEVVEAEPVLEADKTSLMADGTDAVTFTVTLDGTDVTSLSQISVNAVVISGNKFSTYEPGRYAVKAVCDGKESNTLVLEASEVEAIESQFVRNVAVFEFTGAWCTFCPSGYSNMNFVISRNSAYKETVHIMAFHSSGEGIDDLAIPETDKIMSDMKIGTGFPSFLTDLRTGGGLADGNTFKSSLVEAFEQYPSHCGVALESQIADGKIKVNAKLHSEKTSSYRIAVFVVEDNVKYYQKDGSLTYDSYNHRHVVRRIISSSYKGDRLGDVKAGEEVSKEYETNVDPAWNAGQVYIYALAIDDKGFVNNLCICPVNGKSDFNRI